MGHTFCLFLARLTLAIATSSREPLSATPNLAFHIPKAKMPSEVSIAPKFSRSPSDSEPNQSNARVVHVFRGLLDSATGCTSDRMSVRRVWARWVCAIERELEREKPASETVRILESTREMTTLQPLYSFPWTKRDK